MDSQAGCFVPQTTIAELNHSLSCFLFSHNHWAALCVHFTGTITLVYRLPCQFKSRPQVPSCPLKTELQGVVVVISPYEIGQPFRTLAPHQQSWRQCTFPIYRLLACYFSNLITVPFPTHLMEIKERGQFIHNFMVAVKCVVLMTGSGYPLLVSLCPRQWRITVVSFVPPLFHSEPRIFLHSYNQIKGL